MIINYKKNMFCLLLTGICIGSATFGMGRVTGTFADRVKAFGKKAEAKIENLQNQVIAQAKRALETSDPKLLQLAQNALNKALRLPLLKDSKMLKSLSDKINAELQQRAAGNISTKELTVVEEQAATPTTQELAVGDVAYLPATAIRPGQLRYAKNNVDEKAKKQRAKGLLFDDSKSSIDKKDALPIIKGPLGYVLVDGHHDFLASIQVGAQTVPVKLVADLSNLNEDAFYKKAMEEGYIHPYKIGEITLSKLPSTISMDTMQNDPNRWFAAIITRKCPNEQSPTTESFSQADEGSYAYNYPVYVKETAKGVARPFIEFLVADVLYKNNITYDYSMGNNPPEELVEKARRALKANPIARLRLIPEPTLYTEVNGGNICAQPELKTSAKKTVRFAEKPEIREFTTE